MNHCDTMRLVAYVDGALPPAEMAQTAAHLKVCASCRRTVEEQSSMKRLVAASAARIAVPAGLSARMSSALDKLPPPSSGPVVHPPRWWKVGLPLSVATVVTTAGLWFAGTRPQPVDVPAIVSVHRHAYAPPAGKVLATSDANQARAWLADRLGEPSSAPAIGLPLNAVGACHVDEDPAAIWIYRAEQPVTLIETYARRRPPAWSESEVRPEIVSGTYAGYNALIWSDNRHTYALVSKLPRERLAQILERCP